MITITINLYRVGRLVGLAIGWGSLAALLAGLAVMGWDESGMARAGLVLAGGVVWGGSLADWAREG